MGRGEGQQVGTVIYQNVFHQWWCHLIVNHAVIFHSTGFTTAQVGPYLLEMLLVFNQCPWFYICL